MSLPFRERDPRPIGAIGLAVLLVLVLLAFNVQKLPFIGGGRTYHAAFSEAGGIAAGDPVRIAGVDVGKVDRRRPRERPRDGDVHGQGRHPAGRRHRGRGQAADPAGQEVPRDHAGRTGPPVEQPGDPAVADHPVVRRGRCVLGPDHHDAADRQQTAGAVARDAGHDVQGQPGRREVLARRAVPALRDDRVAGRPAAPAAVPGQRGQRHGGQPQRAGRLADPERRRAAAGAGCAAGRDPHALPQHLAVGPAAHRAGLGQPGPADSGARPAARRPHHAAVGGGHR